MSKIIKLDKNLANQISAGEVVERPVSVIKEIIENSIDAGATNIKVEISQGGIDYMSIIDNGEGIEAEDLEIIFEKYTTSKISSIEDLYKVMTFGFRGEAIASISSVSNMSIISKTPDQNSGYSIETQQNEVSHVKQCSSENGTKVVVKDLFYNTPARLNYLKKERTEYSHIYNFLQQMSLSYPHIGFEFISDGKQVFQYRQGETLETRVYNVYGKDFSENLLDICYEVEGLKIHGVISDPKVSFPNRNRQSLFINNRVVKSPLLMKSISDAYNRFIPHNMHAGYILFIDIDPTQIDVNVHPRKMEVRFANESHIFRSVYHTIQSKLDNVSLIKDDINTSQDQSPSHTGHFSSTSSFSVKESTPQYYTGSGTKFKSYSPYSQKPTNPDQATIDSALNFSQKIMENKDYVLSNDLHDTPVGKIIGQAHNSYILVESDSGIIIYDQHALAERILYEKLVKNDSKHKVQGLLLGENIKLTSQEESILNENKEIFESMGFEFEILPGNTALVHAIPDFIKKEDISSIFLGVLSDIGEHNFQGSKTLDEVKNKIFAYTACRSAIKFGNKLSLFEINKLLHDAVLDYSATCPHGRPVVFDISLKELQDKYER